MIESAIAAVLLGAALGLESSALLAATGALAAGAAHLLTPRTWPLRAKAAVCVALAVVTGIGALASFVAVTVVGAAS